MKPDEFISQIKQAEEPFIAYFEQLHDQDKFNIEFNDLWTIKDILAHVLWYEEEMVKMIATQSIESTSEIWDYELDERNQLIYQEMQDISGVQLLKRHNIAIQEIIDGIDNLSEDHLNDSSFFTGMPKDWTPWKIIAGSTFFHYNDHLRRMKEFME